MLCTSHRLTVFFFVIALYFTIKFLFLANEDYITSTDYKNLPFDAAAALITRSPGLSGSTGDVDNPVTVTTIDPLIKLLKNNCLSDNLGVPDYVKSVDCSGVDFFCDELNCRNLLHGNDKDIYILAKDFMIRHPKSPASDESYINATRNCAEFKQSRGYHINPVTLESANFPIAFTILVHSGAEQIERLLRSIYRPQNVYCIHVDGKASKTLHTAAAAIAACFDKVFIASKVTKIIYAGFSRLQADLYCMEELVNRSHYWKYLINLEAQSFPLQTVEEMVKILKIYNGANDIEGIYGRRVIKWRFEREWIENFESVSLNKTGRPNHKPPHEIDIVRGSAYGIFSREFLDFALNDQKAHDLLEWSKKTYSPDEHFWATLHHAYTNPHLHAPGSYKG